jgi:hypothetical protein
MKIPLKNSPIPKFPYGTGIAETPEEFIQALKSIRGWMLSESDWTQNTDSPLNEEVKLEWRTWRQSMRDIADNVTIDNVEEWFEIPNPPTNGQPSHWQYWDYDTYNEIISIFMDIGKQTDAIMQQQEQTTEHARLHETGEQHVH